MKLHPDDPRLTAWLLGELPPNEAESVQREIESDPALQETLWEINQVRDTLNRSLTPPLRALTDEQRETIRHAARAKQALSFPAKASWRTWGIGLAAAASITLIGVALISKSHRDDGFDVTETSPESKASPADAESTSQELPEPTEPAPYPNPGDVAAADLRSLELPIQTSAASLARIQQSVRTEHRLPSPDAVRIEEILNHFSLRLSGAAVVARFPAAQWHPDTRGNGATTHTATLTTETLPCPWKPSATLVLISFRGNPYSACEISAKFHANADNILRYRLLGLSEGSAAAPVSAPTHLPIGGNAMLALEMDTANSANELGSIEWSINGEAAPPVQLTLTPDAEPSNDARFASLACAYAQWLTGEASSLIDAELVSALAREVSADDLPEDRADFVKLVSQSLNL